MIGLLDSSSEFNPSTGGGLLGDLLFPSQRQFTPLKPYIERQRQPGGRADEMTPLPNYTPFLGPNNILPPSLMAPWLPDYDQGEALRRFHLVRMGNALATGS